MSGHGKCENVDRRSLEFSTQTVLHHPEVSHSPGHSEAVPVLTLEYLHSRYSPPAEAHYSSITMAIPPHGSHIIRYPGSESSSQY